MQNMGYGQQGGLKDIVEKETEEKEQPAVAKEEEEQQEGPAAVKELQQDDDEWYDTITKIILVRKEKPVKEFRVTGNLNSSSTRMITANITPHIKMRVKVLY